MNVGVFHPPTRLESFGGSLAVTLSTVKALAESSYEVTWFVRDKINKQKLSKLMGDTPPNNIKIIVKSSILRSRSLINLYENAIKLLLLRLKCNIVVDTYSCYIFPWSDVCYIHFPYVNNILFKQRFPYLTKRRGILFDAINLPYIFFEKNLQNYDQKLLIANSYFTANAIKETIKINPKVLYPPVSTSFLKWVETFEKNQRQNLVVTVGRITKDKKMEAIPQIAHTLRGKNISFVIVGFLHDKETFEKINFEIKRFGLSEKVKILTNVSKEELKRILGTAKVYLHPPTIEHFGISIAEAMGVGCIPVVYEVGGAKEFVPVEFVYKNLEEAAEKVEKAINAWSPKEARRMNAIVQKFSETNFRKKFIKIFSDYCSQLKGR